MKKVLATTMATLLFGLSFPVNTFALPNNQSVTINQNSNMQLIQNPQNGQHLGSVISSESVNNVKPQGYFTVTFKVDESKGTLTIGGQDTSKSELIYFVKPNAGIKLKDVGIFSVKVKDSTKYKLDDSMPWNILPEKYKQDTLVTEDLTLIANIKDLTNQSPGGESNNDQQGMKIAERIKGHLKAKDISVWIGDKINWKDGVELDSSVNNPDLRDAFAKAKFDPVNRDVSSLAERKPLTGKVKVTFSDDSYLEVENQNLYVFSHITASDHNKAPEDAIETTLFLGEGTKVVKDSFEIKGNAEIAVKYKTYKVRPGTNIETYKYSNIVDIFSLIKADVIDDTYSNIRWEPKFDEGNKGPNKFVVNKFNDAFIVKATKTHCRLNFDFQYVDADNGHNSIGENSVPQEIKNKLPKETKIKVGENFVPQKFSSVFATVNNDAGQVEIVYEWIFSGWNPSGILSASKDKKFNGTWKRTQATSADPVVDKITESDKVIKGQGVAGAKIKVTLGNKTLEAIVGQDKNWKVEITKDLKKDEKVSVTQIEMGKKESKVVDTIVSKKAKESKKPDINPMPNPGVKPDNKPLPKPDKKDKAKDQNKENQRESNYFGLKFKNHTSKATRVKTQVENKNLSNKQRDEARYIIDIMSGNYQVIKDGVRQNIIMDVKPLIKNDRLMLPLRSLSEMIGAKVEWDPQTRTASFTNKGIVAKIQIDRNEIVLSNGKVIKMDSKPLNINGRILLPISNVANVFGLTNGNTKDGIDQNIEWDGDNKTVEINLNK